MVSIPYITKELFLEIAERRMSQIDSSFHSPFQVSLFAERAARAARTIKKMQGKSPNESYESFEVDCNFVESLARIATIYSSDHSSDPAFSSFFDFFPGSLTIVEAVCYKEPEEIAEMSLKYADIIHDACSLGTVSVEGFFECIELAGEKADDMVSCVTKFKEFLITKEAKNIFKKVIPLIKAVHTTHQIENTIYENFCKMKV